MTQHPLKPYILTLAVFVLFILFGCDSTDKNTDTSTTEQTPLFKLLDSNSTHIEFVNKVVDTEKFNILTYRNFYNGGGVAIGDINNDSLPDIYFTANQEKNKLYLNKGNFIFEDITEKTGVGGDKEWSTGVSMADVNGDGLLDIYVCNSGDVDGVHRENELFINNGDLTFTEKAKLYNLNNEGYSTHAAFFDYDLDGDLDCYILNNSFKDPGKIELYKKVREIPDAGGDKLMRNDGGVFKDVTTESGIYSSDIGFGLGVAVGDLNNDYLPDIYISNDFWERDYLYINKGKGKFSEELITRINYCSVSSMGADIADINNDGSAEIFTTDMLPGDNQRLKTTISFDPYHLEDLKYRANFHYQMIQNCLHLNDGKANFQEIALLSGVSATDWSWGALIFDFENDGNKDIFVSNGILKDINSSDFRDFLGTQESNPSSKEKLKYTDMIAQIPSKQLKNYAFVHSGQLVFKDRADSLGLAQPSFSNGSAYGDLDNDGDLDLVVNNINSLSFIYRNETNLKSKNHFLKVKFKGYAQNPFGIGAFVSIKSKDGVKILQNFNSRGFESSIEPSLLFGLGEADHIDELTVVWPDRKKQVLSAIKSDQTIQLDYIKASPQESPMVKTPNRFEEVSKKIIKGNTVHRENRYNDFNHEVLLAHMLSTEGPRIIVGDINGDKLDDFILLGAAGDADKIFVQNISGAFNFKSNPSLLKDIDFESTCGSLLDYDSDGDLDLVIGSGGNDLEKGNVNFMVRQYTNDGKGNFTRDPIHNPQVIGNFSTLETEDIDGDGDHDIFLGARSVPGNYGLKPQSYLLKNQKGIWVDMAPPELGNLGMITDAKWSDIDSDGDKDLIVVGEWMSIHIFYNEHGEFIKNIQIPTSSGWWRCFEADDLDNDGDLDLVLGNWGLNTKFKATPAKPLTMFVNDFDNNGKSEFIINWYSPLDSNAYPFAPKPELTFQLPALKKNILKHEDYAGKTYETLFSSEVRKTGISYKADFMESAILWNEGNNNFKLVALPIEAQVSPVFGIIIEDLDQDGKKDLWLGGNFYGLKPQAGRHDASRGVFIKGDGKRNFIVQPQNQLGLYVEGEVRDAAMIRSALTKRLLIARNNAAALMFQRTGE